MEIVIFNTPGTAYYLYSFMVLISTRWLCMGSPFLPNQTNGTNFANRNVLKQNFGFSKQKNSWWKGQLHANRAPMQNYLECNKKREKKWWELNLKWHAYWDWMVLHKKTTNPNYFSFRQAIEQIWPCVHMVDPDWASSDVYSTRHAVHFHWGRKC